MGDYDSEMYNTANYTYNEALAIHELLKEINKNTAMMVQELKGLRAEMTKK